MNIRLGIYDIFSRIVPGGFYMAAFIQFAVVMGWISFDWAGLQKVELLPSLALAFAAYVVGAAMDRIAVLWHNSLFKKRGMSARVLQEFKEKHADHWTFDFEDKDWTMLRAYIRIHNLDVAGDIDRDNAMCIMLRNVSLGLVLATAVQGIAFAKSGDWFQLGIGAILLFLSVQAGIQARQLRDWFYNGVFETILAYRLDLEQRVKVVKPGKKK